MTDEEKIVRLSAILGVEGAVQYGAYRGYGERSSKKGHREARLGGNSGDGSDDAAALRSLVCQMERTAVYVPTRHRSEANRMRLDAESARHREASARAGAERYESEARNQDACGDVAAAQYAEYLAACGPEES